MLQRCVGCTQPLGCYHQPHCKFWLDGEPRPKVVASQCQQSNQEE